ncbi:hypothetical protein BC628DRAFT_82839 [Trametes gibbosa]|nr:hypothetical protein BC628DRAFT_82839 [Trametes gibbosa]
MLAFQQLQYVKMIRAIAFRRQAILRAVLANQNTTPDVNGNAPPQLPAAGFNPSVHAQFAPLHAQQQQQQPAQLQMPSPITVPQVMDMSPFTQKTQAPGWEAPLDAGFCDFTAAQNNPIQDAAQPDNALAPTTSEPGDAPSQLDSPMLGPLPTWKEEHEDAPVPSVMENSHSAATGEGDDAGQSVSTDALDDIQTYDNAPFDALPVRAVWQEDLDDLSFDSSEGKAWFDFTDSV